MFLNLSLVSWIACQAALGVDFRIETRYVNMSRGRAVVGYRVSNAPGSPSYQGPVRINGFLVPEAYEGQGSPHAFPVLLPSVMMDVTLCDGCSEDIQVATALPSVPAGNYSLAAYINGDIRGGETSRLNNVTERLWPVGRVENKAHDPESLDSDLYVDVPRFTPQSGFVAVPWRLFKRGSVDVAPTFYNLFFLVDHAAGRVSISTYEKSAHWINMGQDHDARGRLTPYDVYQNPVGVAGLKSGEYGVITWIDSRETLSEQDRSNNMHMRKVSLSRMRFGPQADNWFSFVGDASEVQVRAVEIATDFGGAGTWQIDPATIPAGMTISPMNGVYADRTSRATLMVTVDGAQFGQGLSSIPVGVRVNQGRDENLSLLFTVTNDRAPLMTAPIANQLTLEARKMEKAEGWIELVNDRSEASLFELKENGGQWVYFNGTGVYSVAPRTTVRVPVIADTRSLAIGSASANITVRSTGRAPVTLPLTLTVRAP